MKMAFVKQDCWIGLYWKTIPVRRNLQGPYVDRTTWYLCLIPCFPIIWETYAEAKARAI